MVALTKLPAKVQPPMPMTLDLFGNLRGEVARVFEDFDRGWWGVPLWKRSGLDWSRRVPTMLTPSVDIAERDNMYEVIADLPGVDEKNIEVSLSGDMLTIKGKREERKEEEEGDYYVSERQLGAFERSFQLPEGVDGDKIDARFKKGVLTVSIPKKPEALKAEKKISIQAN
jgi:HSP20 family protein